MAGDSRRMDKIRWTRKVFHTYNYTPKNAAMAAKSVAFLALDYYEQWGERMWL